MAKDMAVAAKEMFEAAKFEIISDTSEMLPEGWSIHELGTARMGADRKTSVLNQFQQSHDVNNLLVVDGSISLALPRRIQPGPSWRFAGAPVST